MKISTIGSYPKIPAGPGPSVRSAIQRFERGAIGPWGLHDTYHTVIRETLAIAAAASLDATTDGQIRWYDAFDPLCRDIDNLEPGGLLRWFDNNFYYRHPVVTGRLQFQGGTLAAWTREAVAMSSVPITVALPGPFTLQTLLEDRSYHNPATLLADIVEVLQIEVASLSDTGIFEVQWDEPVLAFGLASPSVENVHHVYRDLLGSNPVRQSVALYWGASGPWLSAFESAARVSIDAVTDPTGLNALAREHRPFEIGLGLINARDIRLEDPGALARIIEPFFDTYDPGRVWLHPNAGLELLPPDRAAQKIDVLTSVKRVLQGGEK